MSLSPQDIDGKYEIRSETSDGGPYLINGDGVTEVRDGRTYRKDKNGFIWESVFKVSGKDKVALESTLDPSLADEDLFIKDNKNNLTRQKVTYKGDLIARQENGRLTLRGEIKHGIVTTRITMVKLPPGSATQAVKPIQLLAQLTWLSSALENKVVRAAKPLLLTPGAVIHLADEDVSSGSDRYSFEVVAVSETEAILKQRPDRKNIVNKNGFASGDMVVVSKAKPATVGPNVPGGGPVWTLSL